jgi:RHS repeat-associated protein
VNSFYHSDWIGSTRYVTGLDGLKTAGLSFDAWGKRAGTDPAGSFFPSDLQFAGAFGYQTEWSSSTEAGLGLQYLQQRYYDAAIGRFISADPISIAGGLNVYGYASNNPVSTADPSGLEGHSVDLAGMALMNRWLYGAGKTVVTNPEGEKTWGDYMMRNEPLAGFVAAELGDVVESMRAMPIGSVEPFFIETSGSEEKPLRINTNGEGWFFEQGEHLDGYTLLNGPNAKYGGLQIVGAATKRDTNVIEFSGTCQWNDYMDSHYWQDTVKMKFATGFFSSPELAMDYVIRLRWHFESVRTWNSSIPQRGWPFMPHN